MKIKKQIKRLLIAAALVVLAVAGAYWCRSYTHHRAQANSVQGSRYSQLCFVENMQI